MKEETHPEWYPNAEIVFDGEVVMTVGSTQPRMVVDVWSGTHPFYTGKDILVDTEGQVDRFMRRLETQRKLVEAKEKKVVKKDPRSMEIAIMGLDSRATNALLDAGFTTVGDVLTAMQEDEDKVLAVQGIGQTAMINIRKHLRMEELIE